jgi:hypothetical protein
MKKWIVIATMAFSMTALTACGTKNDTADDTAITENQSEEANTDSQDDTEAADTDTTENDGTQADTEDDTEDTDASTQDSEETDTETDTDEDSGDDGEEEELIETGEKPDFKVNKNGCFNGTYEGNDGCLYKFTKKGILTITSDSETLEYEYSLNEDILNMVATDGSVGKVLQITLLEDGTYLLDNAMGDQVVLTYTE